MCTAIDLLIMHHENMRILYPDEDLLVLCECDGAVYDMRALALHVLRSFDRVHDTGFFRNITLDHVPQPLPDIDELLFHLTIPIGISADIADWYARHVWDREGLLYAHRPLGNVMKVLRCLQLQERTHVGLCAERAGRSDDEFQTLVAALGRTARMAFDRDMLYLDDAAPGEHASERIIRACSHFQRIGYRLVAVIDNRHASGLSHLYRIDEAMEVLLLQASAVREMQSVNVPLRATSSPGFKLCELVHAAACGSGLTGAPRQARLEYHDAEV